MNSTNNVMEHMMSGFVTGLILGVLLMLWLWHACGRGLVHAARKLNRWLDKL